MATYEEAYEQFTGEMEEMGLSYQEELFHGIMKHLGPSVHNKDAALVACSDDNERKTIRENFLIGKLGLENSPRLDEAIEEICHALGESNRQKHRPIFYYLLTGIFHKEDVFIERNHTPLG